MIPNSPARKIDRGHDGARRVSMGALLLVTAAALADPTLRAPPSMEPSDSPPVLQSRDAERELRTRPNDSTMRLATAQAYLAEADASPSKREAAARHVQVLLERSPNDFNALLLMGQIELQKGRPAVAVVHLQNAASLAPNEASVQLTLGDALTSLGDSAGAAAAFAHYRRIMGMAPLPDDDTRQN
jgi:tetratricopeptide (TPR) repeat protein